MEEPNDAASKKGESRRQRSIGRTSGGRGRQKTSKSRKRKGSKGSKHRFGSIYKDSESSEGDEVSDNFSQFNKIQSGQYGVSLGNNNGFYTKQTAASVGIAAANLALADAETSQDIERLCREIEAYEKKFDDQIQDDQH